MRKQVSALLVAAMLSNSLLIPAVFAAGTSKSMSSDVILELDTGDEEQIVEVSVPLQIPIKLSKDGIVSVDQSLGIQNLSPDLDVTLKSVQVVGQSSWQIQDFSTDFSSFEVNEKKLAMSFKGKGTTSGGIIDTEGGWIINASEKMLLETQAKVPMQTEEVNGSIATVNYSFEASSGNIPVPGAITNDWKDKPVLKTSVTPVTFTFSEGTEEVTLTEVKSLNPDVATITAADTTYLAENNTATYNVTAVSNGTATMEASLSNGEKTTFDVEVYSLDIPGSDSSGQGGNISITLPGKEPGSSISTGDVVIDLPTTSESGEDTITVTPEIPEDTVLEVGDNTITVVVDIDGVKITINITITVDVSNPSDGLHQSIEEAQAAGFTFSSYDSGLQIDSFENKQFKSEINIPEQIGDFKVLKISDNVFKNQSNLKKVTIPSTVTTIGANAFSGCTGFEELLLPSSITSIGNNAFSSTGTASANGKYHVIVGCNLPDSKNTTYTPFVNSNVTRVTVIEGVTKIGENSFRGIKSLEEVKLPNSLNYIGTEAFLACTSLKVINLPESLANIGTNVFGSCSSLVSINIPRSIANIPNSLFYNCTSLSQVEIPEGLNSIGTSAFGNCTSLTKLSVPSTVQTIGSYAFGKVPWVVYNGPAEGSPWGAVKVTAS